MTDDEFKSDLISLVTDKFYAQLKKGSLSGHEPTWQMAVAMAIGKVKDKFKKMKRTATGIAVWVNTLDVYKYVGAADITFPDCKTPFAFFVFKREPFSLRIILVIPITSKRDCRFFPKDVTKSISLALTIICSVPVILSGAAKSCKSIFLRFMFSLLSK